MSSSNHYTPPKVWKWEKPAADRQWRYSSVNRPIAGATHDAELPVGKHPLQLYSRGTPNGVKVTEFTEGDPVPARKFDFEPQRGPRPQEGYIGLQNHSDNDIVFFKEVAVKMLKK